MSADTKMFQEINLDIPSDKVNDLEFVQRQFLNVAFDLCKKLSQYSDKSFVDFVNEFVPAQKGITDEFLETWGLSSDRLNLKNSVLTVSETPTTDTPVIISSASSIEQPESSSVNSPVEEIPIKITKKKKTKTKKDSSPVNSPVEKTPIKITKKKKTKKDSSPVNSPDEETSIKITKKKKTKKKRKIKIVQ